MRQLHVLSVDFISIIVSCDGLGLCSQIKGGDDNIEDVDTIT